MHPACQRGEISSQKKTSVLFSFILFVLCSFRAMFNQSLILYMLRVSYTTHRVTSLLFLSTSLDRQKWSRIWDSIVTHF